MPRHSLVVWFNDQQLQEIMRQAAAEGRTTKTQVNQLVEEALVRRELIRRQLLVEPPST